MSMSLQSSSRASSRRSAECFRTLRVGFTAARTSPARDEGAEEDTGREERQPARERRKTGYRSEHDSASARCPAWCPPAPPTHTHTPITLALAAVPTWRGRCGQQLMPWTRPAPTPVRRALMQVDESYPTLHRTHPASALLHRALPLPQRRARHTPRALDRPPTATPASDPHPTSECKCKCDSPPPLPLLRTSTRRRDPARAAGVDLPTHASFFSPQKTRQRPKQKEK
ncbi:hypothetical protein B0H14DRAFT_3617310 [Mycena olivaceomarginata]|nr:hypothetical protein B0H14DRAFT_3617310 [Mycena olivaceomarginata]